MLTDNSIAECYKSESDKYNKTRDIHWKLNIAIWTIIIVAIYAQAHHEIELGSFWFQFALCAVFLLIHFFFINEIHGSLVRSLWRMHDMASYLADPTGKGNLDWSLVGDRTYHKWYKFRKIIKDLPKKKKLKRILEILHYKFGNWEVLQLLITIFLLWIYLIVVDHNICR